MDLLIENFISILKKSILSSNNQIIDILGNLTVDTLEIPPAF